jgi:hypothetical protein
MNDLIVVPQTNQWQKLKALVLDSVSSPITKRVYNLGLDEFIAWYGQEPRAGLARAVSYPRRGGRNMQNKIIVAAIALVAVFLVGFVPQYVRASRLENELRQSRQENAGAKLRDLISLAYVQANQKNFGLGAETTSRFFSRVREMANQTPDASSRKALEDLLALRDRVTAELAKGDTAAMADLQELFDKTRQATRSSPES